jgi:hypothetical protein
MAAVVSAQATAPHLGRLARILGVSPLTSDARSHYRGALGELLVGDVLENLGPTWDVLHDLPLDGSVVDHLLIGPAGVFTVRTANYGRLDVTVDGSAIIVGGERHHDVAEAEAEAGEVSRLLTEASGAPVLVRPLLVIVDALRIVAKSPASGVRVISSRSLESVLARAPRTLTGEEVARVSDLADLGSTWPAAAIEGATIQKLDTQQLHRDFGTIRSRVSDALARRVLWAAGATLVVYVTVCCIIAALVTVVVSSA